MGIRTGDLVALEPSTESSVKSAACSADLLQGYPIKISLPERGLEHHSEILYKAAFYVSETSGVSMPWERASVGWLGAIGPASGR
jgi:hypothetical protein